MLEGQSQQENTVMELDILEHSIPRSVNSLNKLTCSVIVEGSWRSDCLSNSCRVPPFLISQRINKSISHHVCSKNSQHRPLRGYVTRYFVAFPHAFSVIYYSKECSGCLLCEASHV